MYRVELKVQNLANISDRTSVPNVPCGVERIYAKLINEMPDLFLMYRVELKV